MPLPTDRNEFAENYADRVVNTAPLPDLHEVSYKHAEASLGSLAHQGLGIFKDRTGQLWRKDGDKLFRVNEDMAWADEIIEASEQDRPAPPEALQERRTVAKTSMPPGVVSRSPAEATNRPTVAEAGKGSRGTTSGGRRTSQTGSYTITEEDVGDTIYDLPPGRVKNMPHLVKIFATLGRIMPQDVGKRCYERGGIWQCENTEQFLRRTTGKGKRRTAMTVDPNDDDELILWVNNDEGLYNWAIEALGGAPYYEEEPAEAVADEDNASFMRWLDENRNAIADSVNRFLARGPSAKQATTDKEEVEPLGGANDFNEGEHVFSSSRQLPGVVKTVLNNFVRVVTFEDPEGGTFEAESLVSDLYPDRTHHAKVRRIQSPLHVNQRVVIRTPSQDPKRTDGTRGARRARIVALYAGRTAKSFTHAVLRDVGGRTLLTQVKDGKLVQATLYKKKFRRRTAQGDQTWERITPKKWPTWMNWVSPTPKPGAVPGGIGYQQPDSDVDTTLVEHVPEKTPSIGDGGMSTRIRPAPQGTSDVDNYNQTPDYRRVRKVAKRSDPTEAASRRQAVEYETPQDEHKDVRWVARSIQEHYPDMDPAAVQEAADMWVAAGHAGTGGEFKESANVAREAVNIYESLQTAPIGMAENLKDRLTVERQEDVGLNAKRAQKCPTNCPYCVAKGSCADCPHCKKRQKAQYEVGNEAIIPEDTGVEEGYYVMTWGGDEFTAVAWYALRDEAEEHRKKLIDAGQWQGRPPKIVPAMRKDGAVNAR